jgi:hypothetical protein
MNTTPDADDQRVIDQVLADLDAERADDLRPLLSELRFLAHGAPVEPGPLAALLLPEDDDGSDVGAEAAPTTVLRAVPGTGPRRPARAARRRRPLAAAAILAAAAVGAGAAAAAADEGFRSSVNDGISTIVGVLGGHTDPKPPAPASSVTPQGSVPAAPAPGTAAPTTSPSAGQPTPSEDVRSAAPGAKPTPSATQPGALPQLPSPNLGVPVPTLPALPGGLPQPTAPAGELPGSLR